MLGKRAYVLVRVAASATLGYPETHAWMFFFRGKRHRLEASSLKQLCVDYGGEHVWVRETMPVARRLRCWLGNWLLPNSGFCHTGFLPTGLLPRGLEPIRASARRARPGEVRMQA